VYKHISSGQTQEAQGFSVLAAHPLYRTAIIIALNFVFVDSLEITKKQAIQGGEDICFRSFVVYCHFL
jgi:hypothetical protein